MVPFCMMQPTKHMKSWKCVAIFWCSVQVPAAPAPTKPVATAVKAGLPKPPVTFATSVKAGLPKPQVTFGTASSDSLVEALVSAAAPPLPAAAPQSPQSPQPGASELHVTDAQRKDARNTYMRFWRSLQGSNTSKIPQEILDEYNRRKGVAGATYGALTAMYEDFVQSKENWMKSAFFSRLCKTSTRKKRGVWAWKTMDKLKELYGEANTGIIADMVQRKMQEGAWKWHPDFPNVENMRLYRCFDSAMEEQEEGTTAEIGFDHRSEADPETMGSFAESNWSAFEVDQPAFESQGTAAPAPKQRPGPKAAAKAGTKGGNKGGNKAGMLPPAPGTPAPGTPAAAGKKAKQELDRSDPKAVQKVARAKLQGATGWLTECLRWANSPPEQIPETMRHSMQKDYSALAQSLRTSKDSLEQSLVQGSDVKACQ